MKDNGWALSIVEKVIKNAVKKDRCGPYMQACKDIYIALEKGNLRHINLRDSKFPDKKMQKK